MASAVAICSCPRLGFMDFMGMSLAAFAQNNVGYHNAFGAYWSQALQEAMTSAISKDFDYIFICDYDSIFTKDHVAALFKLMEDNPHADAITSVQMGRSCGLLFGTESGEITDKELEQDIAPISQGHFGLSIFRSSSLKKLEKPWFKEIPDSNGGFAPKSDKIDADVFFWRNAAKQGFKSFVAPRVVIGHLELLIKWPDTSLQPMYQILMDYYNDGPPGDVWQ